MTHSQKQKWKRKKRVRAPPPISARARARGLGSARRVSLSRFKEEPRSPSGAGQNRRRDTGRYRTRARARTQPCVRLRKCASERAVGQVGRGGGTQVTPAQVKRFSSARLPCGRLIAVFFSFALLCFTSLYLIDPLRRGHGRTRTSWVLGNSRVTRVSHVLRSRSCQTTPVLSPLSFSFIRSVLNVRRLPDR